MTHDLPPDVIALAVAAENRSDFISMYVQLYPYMNRCKQIDTAIVVWRDRARYSKRYRELANTCTKKKYAEMAYVAAR